MTISRMMAALHHLIELERTDYKEALLLSITAVFVFLSAITYSLAADAALTLAHLWAPVCWLVLMGSAFALLTRFKPHHDPYILPITALLSGWGLVLLDRLAANFLARQVMWLALGTAVLVTIAILPHNLRWLRQYRYTLLITGLLLLAGTLIFGVNPSGYGAALWLPVPLVGHVYFQPSELLKLLLVIFLASYFDQQQAALQKKHGRFGPLPYLAPLLLMWGFCMMLLVWQRDLGAATLFFILFLTLLYVATGNGRYVMGGFILLLLAGIFAYFAFDVVTLRVDAWWNPWPDADNRAFQIVQSLYALAAGGLLGQGIGQGYPQYIPVVHSDFAFAAVAEEWGLLGALTITTTILLLVHRGMRTAMLAQRPFRLYLATGITILFATQSFLIMGGVAKLLPLTGVTLPLLSYGGSSMLLSCTMLGLILYMSGNPTSQPQLVSSAMAQPRHRLRPVTLVILIAFAAVIIAILYWSIGRSATLLNREDNPRLVEAELAIQRGRILDRNGRILAETIPSNGRLRRQYPIANIGPAVGYYSFRHGAAGIEESANTDLRGAPESEAETLLQQWLHLPQQGHDIQITLDANLQAQADDLLGEQQGAVILLDLTTGEILAMASHPSYDPNLLNEQFTQLTEDATSPLLNRAVQGLYQPGLLLQPLILAAAVADGRIALTDPVENPNAPVPLNNHTTQCTQPITEPATWSDVLQAGCPSPMQTLGAELGATELNRIFAQFGLTSVPDLPLAQATPIEEPPANTALASIGQDNLLVTPLQLLRAWSAFGPDGRLTNPQLLLNSPGAEAENVLTPTIAAIFRNQLTSNGRIEYSRLVLSGPDGLTHAWYLGMAPAPNPTHAVVVVLEDNADLAQAETIGRTLLDTAVNQ
jgi:cell division protein FtsW (lipid II flippase)